MSEQFELSFESPEDRYQKLVGVKPLSEMTPEEILKAIQNPEEERVRRRLLDLEEDQEDRRQNRL